MKNSQLLKIIKPLNSANYQVDIFWNDLERSLQSYCTNYGGLDLNPDFQRGHVWTEKQQTHFVENVLRGIVPSSGLLIQWNCPNWDDFYYKGELPLGFQCIDGLQRLTAIRKYIKGEISPFGLSINDLNNTSFSIKRCFYVFKFAIHNMTKKSDLLSHYLDINSGGTQHSEDEINKVRKLLKETQND